MSNEKIHEAELEVAKHFVEICKKNNLEYFMLGGTFLGAVRHKGFIPWDDDMDFGMPRRDYEQFIKIVKTQNNGDYLLAIFEDGNNHDYPIKLESTKQRIKEFSTGKERVRNAWIDIFPLDGMPNSKLAQNVQKFRLLSLRALFKLSQLSKNVSVDNPYRTSTEKIIISVGRIIRLEKLLSEEKLFHKLDRQLKKYSYENSDFVVNFMGAYKFKEMFPKKIYEDLISYEFEDVTFKAPTDYDLVLTQMYGDYLVPPKDEDKNKHNTEIQE
ncbi:LicD family protein [Enterococcus faecium]|nr:LicD family protein [Enterococcus faecium]